MDLARLPALGTYLASKGFFPQEGSASSLQQVWFETLLTKEKSIVEISEVGFNCGTSAMSFLGARADINLVSFDIGLHPYVGYAKQYVDNAVPESNLPAAWQVAPSSCKGNVDPSMAHH